MNTNLPKQIILITMKCIPFFIGLIFLYSCESFTNDKKNREIMDHIFSLKSSIESLNKNVDSLNLRVLQLENRLNTKESQTDQILPPKAEEKISESKKKVICTNCNGEGSTQETCDNCRGSGYKYNRNCKTCSQYNTSSQGKGYVNRTCNVCRGIGRVNEYE
jgi:hypothetical protein